MSRSVREGSSTLRREGTPKSGDSVGRPVDLPSQPNLVRVSALLPRTPRQGCWRKSVCDIFCLPGRSFV